MVLQTWGDVLVASFQQLWIGIIEFLPKLIIAFIIFIVGWIIAVALGKFVNQVIRAIKLDRLLQSLGIEEPLSRAGFRLDSGAFLGGLVRWFFILVFLLTSVEVLGLSQITSFLSDVVINFVPNVIVAALILVAAAFIADAVHRIILGSAKAAVIPSSGFVAGIAKWAIWIFAILAALYQLGIAGPFVQTLFTGFVAMLVLAVGLAFGLGGKDIAAQFIEKLKRDISR